MKRIATIGQYGTPKVGSYAQHSSNNVRPWSKTNKKEAAKSRRRKKKVINPIFTKCAEISTDPFWKDKFDKASFGKFPRGFSLNKNYLVYKRGTKNETVMVPDTPYEAYSVCISFFQSVAQIYSDEDREHQREEERLMQLQQQLKERTWAKTLKRQKEVLVGLFVQELREKDNLSVKAAQRLEDIINIELLYNHFNKDNIILEEGMISEIVGLVYDEALEEYVTEEPLKPKTSKSSSKSKKIEPSSSPRHVPFTKEKEVDFYDEWCKLLDAAIKVPALKETEETMVKDVRISRVTSSPSRTTPSPSEFESTFTPTMTTTE